MYLCGMNMKRCGNYIIIWVGFTILTFFLYDIIWVFANNDWIKEVSVDSFMPLWIDLSYSALFSFFSILFSSFIIRNNLLDRIKHRRAMTFGLIMLAFNMLLAIFFEKGIMDFFSEPIDDGDTWGNAYFMGLTSTVVSLIFTVEHYVKMSAKRQQENAELRMRLLKMQLNPHFIFNSLSALACLISTNPNLAEKYVVRLSKIYRYILRHMDADVVTIREALAFVRDYVSLLQLRYENIELEMPVFKYDDNEYILSFSLQVLIENAVKNNAPNSYEKLSISINREGNNIVVSNNILRRQDMASKNAGYGVGLTNLMARNRMKLHQDIIVEKSPDKFKVYIPITKAKL